MKKVYMAVGYNTISMGTGRPEFHPAKPRPGLEHYISEAGKAVIAGINQQGDLIDEAFIGNFQASLFNKQAHLGGFIPMIDPALAGKPAMRVEGACASGGLALASAIRSVLAGTGDVVLAMGVEVQNTLKAIYGADVLAAAGWYQKRKSGHAYFFPGQFSNRAGAYYERFGRDYTRKGLARWFKNAIENARLCPTAQEFENKVVDLEALALTEPNGKFFVDHLNVYDCSKVSDGASAILVLSEEGLKKCGINPEDAVEIAGWSQVARDITADPEDLTVMSATRLAVAKALKSAGISMNQVSTVETHDCFTIAGVLGVEAMGLAAHGQGAAFVADGATARDGVMPINTTGGLIGWGHPTGATGVHQAVTVWEQLTGKAGAAQIIINPDKPYALSINMGGDDVTVVAIVYKKNH
ncbi:MAG: 3-ketoacyl-CoA thiolase [Sphingobacteriia bacterium]|nr:3-ketoacyl-CoA thiolase [Sphingobacteriia bacterium]